MESSPNPVKGFVHSVHDMNRIGTIGNPAKMNQGERGEGKGLGLHFPLGNVVVRKHHSRLPVLAGNNPPQQAVVRIDNHFSHHGIMDVSEAAW